MELNSENVAKYLYPIAAFNTSSDSSSINSFDEAGPAQPKPRTWDTSTLNPKNRIDSVAVPSNAKWRVDGSAGMGTQFYAIPIVLHHPLPLRIDTFIPERREIAVDLHSALDISSAFYIRDSRVAQLGIAGYIIRVLDRWSSWIPDFLAFYNSLPFGSRIVLQNIDSDIQSVRVQVLPTHFLEKQLLSAQSLQAMWNLSTDSWPKTTDISNVRLIQQLHDSVSLVEHNDETRIMKSLTSSPKYLYHELKVLLTMGPHPNIISKPSHVIVKKCNFGNKLAVVGFIIDYHPAGALRDVLSFRRLSQSLTLQSQLNWAVQLTETLIHTKKNNIMYCDLRLDNIVLDRRDAIVMIDFEARGVGTFMTAPEIVHLEYIQSLANEHKQNRENSELETFARLHEVAMIGHSIPVQSEIYRNPKNGYCLSWLCLSEEEREAAQVYMLGKVIWGIFEGTGSPEKGLLVEHLREHVLEYPEWRTAPQVIRQLVKACCSSPWRYERFPLVRRGQKICLRNGEGSETASQIRDAACQWWIDHVQTAKEFIEQRSRDSETAHHMFSGRPKLEDVLISLKSFRKSVER